MNTRKNAFADQVTETLLGLVELRKREGEDAAKIAAKVGIIGGAVFMEEAFGRDEAMRMLRAVYGQIAAPA